MRSTRVKKHCFKLPTRTSVLKSFNGHLLTDSINWSGKYCRSIKRAVQNIITLKGMTNLDLVHHDPAHQDWLVVLGWRTSQFYTTVTWADTLPAGCRGESCRTSSGSRRSSGGSCERGCCDSSPESPAVGHRCSIRRRKSAPPCTAVARVLPASVLVWWGSCWTPSPGPSRGTCTPGSSASTVTEGWKMQYWVGRISVTLCLQTSLCSQCQTSNVGFLRASTVSWDSVYWVRETNSQQTPGESTTFCPKVSLRMYLWVIGDIPSWGDLLPVVREVVFTWTVDSEFKGEVVSG